MIDIGVGLSLGKNAALAAEEAVRQAKKNKRDGAKVDLAFVFSSPDVSAAILLKTLNNLLGQISIIGSSGAAVICERGIFTHGLVVMLLSFGEGAYFSSACAKDISAKSAMRSGEELGEKLLYGFKNIPRNFGLIFSDRLIEDSSNFINGLQERLGRSFPCLGVSAADTMNSLKVSLFFNRGVINDGCAGILWGGKLIFGLGIKHGWKPLGKPHSVSSSSGHVVNTIDNQPAVKLYEEYLACDLIKLKKELKQLSVSYPIGIFIPGEAEYLLRNVLDIGKDGSLFCQGNVPQGSLIRLMISTKETCLEATRQATQEAEKNLSNSLVPLNKGKSSRLAIAFISVSRYNLLRKGAKKELEIIKEVLGAHTPVIGLYTCGELAPLKASSYRGQIYFHSQTVTVLIIEG